MDLKRQHYVVGIAHLYLSGMSLRAIGELEGKSHVSIRNDLVKTLKNADLSLYYEVINSMESRHPDSLKKEIVRERVVQSINLFLTGNYTVIDIAQMLGTTEFVIYRDLTLRIHDINKYIPNFVSLSNIEKIELICTEHRFQNLKNQTSKTK